MVDSAFKIGPKDYIIKSSQQDLTDGHILFLNGVAIVRNNTLQDCDPFIDSNNVRIT